MAQIQPTVYRPGSGIATAESMAGRRFQKLCDPNMREIDARAQCWALIGCPSQHRGLARLKSAAPSGSHAYPIRQSEAAKGDPVLDSMNRDQKVGRLANHQKTGGWETYSIHIGDSNPSSLKRERREDIGHSAKYSTNSSDHDFACKCYLETFEKSK